MKYPHPCLTCTLTECIALFSEGANGGELMFLPCMDEFLGLQGSCIVYTSMLNTRRAMTKQCRVGLEALKVKLSKCMMYTSQMIRVASAPNDVLSHATSGMALKHQVFETLLVESVGHRSWSPKKSVCNMASL